MVRDRDSERRTPKSIFTSQQQGIHYWQDNARALQFRRDIQDWELNELLRLLSKLSDFKVNPQVKDKLEWGDSKDRTYTVKRGYDNLCSNKELIDKWPWKLIWRTKLPIKVIGFIWTSL